MDDKQKMKVVILTGLSGAGKTNAGDWFEDAGYYCMDNLPPILIDSFLELAKTSRKKIDRAAFIVDVRGGAFFDDLRDCIIRLRADEQIDCSSRPGYSSGISPGIPGETDPVSDQIVRIVE